MRKPLPLDDTIKYRFKVKEAKKERRETKNKEDRRDSPAGVTLAARVSGICFLSVLFFNDYKRICVERFSRRRETQETAGSIPRRRKKMRRGERERDEEPPR